MLSTAYIECFGCATKAIDGLCDDPLVSKRNCRIDLRFATASGSFRVLNDTSIKICQSGIGKETTGRWRRSISEKYCR